MNSVASPLPRDPALLRRLDRYELIGELARGGMGTVYLARHVGEARFQRLFAVKVLHPHLARNTACVDMLLDEARIAARLHHPNAVAVVDLGSQDGLHYVVLDYVEGVPFSTMIQHRGAPSFVEIAVTVVCDMLEGLHAAHSLTDDEGNALQLVHRDVSPQNILVGTDGVARITDFGIAKAEARLVNTQPGARKGKLGFMAPEQITDDTRVDHRADIWAAGVVLWTALTGKHLFRMLDDVATVERVLHKPIRAPSAVVARVPSCFDHVVLRALQRDASARYASALEMAEALRTAASAHGVVCPRHVLGKWVSERFSERLLARREAIRTASRSIEQQRATNEASGLSVLPNVGGHWTAVYGSLSLSGEKGAAAGVPHVTPSESLLPVGISLPHAAPRTKRESWIAACILSAVLAAAIVCLRSSDEAPLLGQSSNAVAAVAARAAPHGALAGSDPSLDELSPAPEPARLRVAPEHRFAGRRQLEPKPAKSANVSRPEPAASMRRNAEPNRAGVAARTLADSTSPVPRAPTPDMPLDANAVKVTSGGSTFEINPYVRKHALQ